MFKVYYEHIWGYKKHLAGVYATEKEAKIARDRVEDSMFDAWIVEEKWNKGEPK